MKLKSPLHDGTQFEIGTWSWYCFGLDNHQKHMWFFWFLLQDWAWYMNATKQWFSVKLPAKTNSPSLSVDPTEQVLQGLFYKVRTCVWIFRKRAKMYKIWFFFFKRASSCMLLLHGWNSRICSVSCCSIWFSLVSLSTSLEQRSASLLHCFQTNFHLCGRDPIKSSLIDRLSVCLTHFPQDLLANILNFCLRIFCHIY